MPSRRPLRRPAVFVERELLWCGQEAAQIVLPRSGALALAELRRLGFSCFLIDIDRSGQRSAASLIRLNARVAAAVLASGGRIDGTFAYPRPGVSLDPGVPHSSAFGRLVLEAATLHGLDLARSTMLAASFDAVEGARIAGTRSVLIGVSPQAVLAAARDRPAVRPDEVFGDLGQARASIAAARQRSIAQGF